MKNLLYLLIGTVFWTFSSPVRGQDAAKEGSPAAAANSAVLQNAAADNSKDFFDEYIDGVETEKEAVSTARQLLNKKPVILKLRQNQVKSLAEMEKFHNEKLGKNKATGQIPTTAQEQEPSPKKNSVDPDEPVNSAESKIKPEETPSADAIAGLQAAPLGLFWGASIAETEAQGFKLKPAERKDYQNVFIVLNPRQKNNTFRLISAIFGINDSLWCIYAESNFMEDDTGASKVLELYHKYYDALKKKYGNAQQFFTPYIEETNLISGDETDNAEKDGTQPAKISHSIGNDNFLKELQEGKAVLYATFSGEDIGVTLGVAVDGEGKSYISLDYKNFALKDKEQKAVFDSVLEGL